MPGYGMIPPYAEGQIITALPSLRAAPPDESV
jgi:hypothetical protein